MAIVNVKEIYKEFNEAKRHFKKAVDLAKKNFVIGEIHYLIGEKKARIKKAKVTPVLDYRSEIIKGEGKELPDLDKSGYMSKRNKNETADNA